MKKIYITTTIVSVFLLSLAGIVLAKTHFKKNVSKVKGNTEKAFLDSSISVDTALVNRLILITSQMDTKKDKVSFSGKIWITDGADSSQNAASVPYTFRKNGQHFYYLLGKGETIGNEAKYLYIDRMQKKMMIGTAHKNQDDTSIFPDAASLANNIISERYTISEKELDNGIMQISLINPNHISCRLYQINYRKEDMRIEKIFLIMSNLTDPTNRSLDRKISFLFQNEKDKETAPESISNYVSNTGDHDYELNDKYKEYELIVMP